MVVDDSNSSNCVTEPRLESFGNCIAKATQLMKDYKFPAVMTMLEEELLGQLRKIGNLFESSSHSDDLKKLFVVKTVDLLIFSHAENSASLKRECLQLLKSFDKSNRIPSTMLTDAWTRLKEYPDLLLYAVSRFPSGRF